MTTRVCILQEGTISALERRVFVGEIIDVDDSLVDMLTSQGWAEPLADEGITAPTIEDAAPPTSEAVG